MIAFPNFLPLVRLESGESLPFEPEWLLGSLARAARKAGLAQWWLAPHVTASVTEYLRADHDGPLIEVARLEAAVRTVLQVIGYSEVGTFFEVGRPVVSISLVEVAREAGAGYELAFFGLLGERLAAVLASGVPHFRLEGLGPCVKLLRARKTLSPECHRLQAEIVSYARQQTGIASAKHDVTFSLT